MTDPMFSPGQCVIYGANGVCTVDGVREMQLPYDDEAQSYYVLKPASKPGSTIYVPTGNETLVGRLRPLLDKAGLDDVLQRVKAAKCLGLRIARPAIRNSTRCIYARRRSLKKAGKHLPGMDDDIMHSCEKLLTQEFSLCLQIPPEEVGEYLHNALDGDPC